MNTPPSGTVTFLFTDIEGSTKLAQEYPDRWETLRERHHTILQSAMDAYNGYVFQIIGDAFCVAFHTVKAGLKAAVDAQRKLQAEDCGETPIKVRMGLHTGTAELQGTDYRGYLTLARVQRVMSTAYGGQVLLSNASAELLKGELPEGVSLRDMKENRLKGLLNPERLWQVIVPDLPEDFPPLETLNGIPNNLPVQLTSFVGREKEIAELKQILASARLVTLTGAGGAGKTRLSLQLVAEMLDRFKNGAWFIDLAPLSDPALVPFTVASALGLRDEPGRPLNRTLLDWLNDKEVLLILDNCEHMVEACSRFADELLHANHTTRILATSREPLGIVGESIYRVPSLPTPDPEERIQIEQLEQYAAVQLFIDRAVQSLSTFRVNDTNAPAVAQICYRLDGIPLAIELAAARVKSLPVEKIAERLDDRFRLLTGGSRTALPRQQTLRSMIDWSHSLLSEPEQILLRRLSIFTGGWTLDVAEEICSGDRLEQTDILDLSTRLVDKSLVIMADETNGSRFHMLETIHQYARENLEKNAEADALRRRHAAYFANLAKEAEKKAWLSGHVQWTDRLERERENFREALRWSVVLDRERSFLQLAGNLWRFWGMRGPVAEGRFWLDQALDVCEANMDTLEKELIVPVLAGAGEIARYQDDFEHALVLKQKLLDMCRQWGEERLMAATLNDLAIMYADHGQCEHSQTVAEEALALRRKLGRPLGIAHALGGLFFARMCLDEPLAAQEVIEEAIQIYRDGQNWEAVAQCLTLVGFLAIRQKRYDDTERVWSEFLSFSHELADLDIVASGIYMKGLLAAAQGQKRQAARLFGIAEQMATRYGFHLEIPGRAWVENTIQAAKSSLSEALWINEYQTGQAFARSDEFTIEQAIAFALEINND